MKINGVEIFVKKIAGKGNIDFVFIHNAGGTHQFFTYQIDKLKNYGNIILLDLPGHGKSEVVDLNKMSDLSEIIVKICNELNLKHICFIGLNNGANIVIDIAANHVLPIKNLILIDPPIFMEDSFVGEINQFIKQLEKPDYEKFVFNLVDALFINTHSQQKQIAREAFLTVDRKLLQMMFKGLIEWDKNSKSLLKNINYPTLCILTDEHHCAYHKLKEEAPHFEVGKVIGSKCWAALEVPDQINSMIERFIALN